MDCEIGAGTAIPSVRHFSHRIVSEFDGILIRINPREPDVPSRRQVSLAMPALAALEGIERAMGR